MIEPWEQRMTITQAAPVRTGRAAPVRGGRPALRLPPRWRKAMLAAHVIVSVGWLGLDIGLLTLGVTGLTTGDPATLQAAYRAMDIFGDVLIVPISVTTFVTGLMLSFGTKWGLMRHYWVAIKFFITAAAMTASIFALRGNIATAAALATGVTATNPPGAELDRVAVSLVAAPTVALTIYTTATILSVLKPWGRTPYGRRRAERERRLA
jgi:hypothetical protein